MSALRDLISENPMTYEGTRIWRRFLRSGTETGRGFNTISLIVLGLFYAWMLLVIVRFREDVSPMLLTLELLTLSIAIPASLYGAVSGEREKQTWDSLVMTRLSPAQILAGKMLWRVLMIVATMAVFAFPTFLSHFVARRQTEYTFAALVWTQFLLLGWSLLLAGFTLMVSAKTKRSITTLSVVVVALLTFLGLVPSLFALFGGRPLIRTEMLPSNGGEYGRHIVRSSPLEIGGGLLVVSHPFFAVQSMHASGHLYSGSRVSDGGMEIYGALLTLTYLLGAWACAAGTLSTLRRLELPENRPDPRALEVMAASVVGGRDADR
ncbi:MAG TPA: hypothetical protein VM490_03710 [Armatimonadaceae bacterium]|nr:hypothetical protein [Armatimonadaceae bacterium]